MTRFDETTQVRPDSRPDAAGARAGSRPHLDESWSSLVGVHGGYVAALTVRAAEAMLPDREVRTVTTSFLRPAKVGAAEVILEILRAGRSFTTVSARVRQASRDVAQTTLTLLNPVGSSGWTTGLIDPPAPPDRCVPFEPPPSIAHFTQAEFRIDPASIPASDPHAAAARIAGHVRPGEARPIDAAWLTVMGDWFPPSPFRRLVPPAGGISIDYAVHIHRTLGTDGDRWLQGVFTSDNNVAGIALEHGTLATAEGIAVAETFHTRWTG